MTKRNPEFGGFSACFAVRAETDRKGKATPPARTETRIQEVSTCVPVISTHSARKDGDVPTVAPTDVPVISTHSAHEDGDELLKDNRRLRDISTHSAHEDGDPTTSLTRHPVANFNPLRPRGRRPQYYTKKPTILHHISTIKSHHTPSNHRQPTLHTSKTVLIVQFFRCESPRKFMFASGSHQTI